MKYLKLFLISSFLFLLTSCSFLMGLVTKSAQTGGIANNAQVGLKNERAALSLKNNKSKNVNNNKGIVADNNRQYNGDNATIITNEENFWINLAWFLMGFLMSLTTAGVALYFYGKRMPSKRENQLINKMANIS